MGNDEQLAVTLMAFLMAHHALGVFDHDVPKRQGSEQHRNTASEAQLGVHWTLVARHCSAQLLDSGYFHAELGGSIHLGALSTGEALFQA